MALFWNNIYVDIFKIWYFLKISRFLNTVKSVKSVLTVAVFLAKHPIAHTVTICSVVIFVTDLKHNMIQKWWKILAYCVCVYVKPGSQPHAQFFDRTIFSLIPIILGSHTIVLVRGNRKVSLKEHYEIFNKARPQSEFFPQMLTFCYRNPFLIRN